MLKIVAACGNGMGTSMIIRLKVQTALRKHNISADVEAVSVGQATGMVNSVDIIICSVHLADQFSRGKAKIATVKNLMDDAEIEKAILEAMKQ